jgi:hypothetical protein
MHSRYKCPRSNTEGTLPPRLTTRATKTENRNSTETFNGTGGTPPPHKTTQRLATSRRLIRRNITTPQFPHAHIGRGIQWSHLTARPTSKLASNSHSGGATRPPTHTLTTLEQNIKVEATPSYGAAQRQYLEGERTHQDLVPNQTKKQLELDPNPAHKNKP